jgi:hypothetical protein
MPLALAKSKAAWSSALLLPRVRRVTAGVVAAVEDLGIVAINDD